jgi:hypothetical protein
MRASPPSLRSTLLFLLLQYATSFVPAFRRHLGSARVTVARQATGFAAAKPSNKNKKKEAAPNRVPKDPAATPCGCGLGGSYADCCQPIHCGECQPTPEELVKSRFTAYKYRLPDFLVSSTWKFSSEASSGGGGGGGGGGNVAAELIFDKTKVNERKRAAKVEKEELLKFIDSYDFADLTITEPETAGGGGGSPNTATVAFSCNLRSRDGGAFKDAQGKTVEGSGE